MKSSENPEDVHQTGKSKILSICMCGRDDDYMLDFKYRITTTINHIAQNLTQLGRLADVEILVADWGSQIPMVQTLNLSPEAIRITRFIYVHPSIIRSMQGGRENFHSARAFNVAIRRACGEYILFYNADTLFPQYSLETLLRLLNGELPLPVKPDQTFFLIPRFNVPWQFLERRPNLDEWDRYLLLFAKKQPLEPVSNYEFFGGSGALLMHRSLWHEVRGIDENLPGWGGQDNDLGLRISQKYPSLSLTGMGIFLCHMGHTPSGSRQSAVSKSNTLTYNATIYANDENWGLGDVNLEILSRDFTSPEQTRVQSDKHEFISNKIQVKSSEDILSELKGNDNFTLLNHVVSCFYRKLWKIDRRDLNAFLFLSWYSSYHFPRRYLEFSVGRSPSASIVAAGCPTVEIYKVEKWERSSSTNSPSDILIVNDCTPEYCGPIRFINGDVKTAIPRLEESFVGKCSFDLIWIKGARIEKDEIVNIWNLLQHLECGGALIVTIYSKESFFTTWIDIQLRYPDFTYILCKDLMTGMILAGPTKDCKQNNTKKMEFYFIPNHLFLLKMKMAILNIIGNIKIVIKKY